MLSHIPVAIMYVRVCDSFIAVLLGVCMLHIRKLGVCMLHIRKLGVCMLHIRKLGVCMFHIRKLGVCMLHIRKLGVCMLHVRKGMCVCFMSCKRSSFVSPM